MIKTIIFCMMLGALWAQHEYHMRNTMVMSGFIELAPREVVIAHKYHGINYSTCINGYYTFERDKVYGMFDGRYFPQLIKLLKGDSK